MQRYTHAGIWLERLDDATFFTMIERIDPQSTIQLSPFLMVDITFVILSIRLKSFMGDLATHQLVILSEERAKNHAKT